MFFSLNHPVIWVRIVGVVVAIDEFDCQRGLRRVYTVDDSTGECIECSMELPKPPKPAAQGEEATGDLSSKDATRAIATTPPASTTPDALAGIDVGAVVDVKGRVKLFRDRKQINIQNMLHVVSTAQEVQFWNKIAEFRREVLGRPWTLDKRDVRRAKRQHLADVDAEERHKRRKERDDLLRKDETGGRFGKGGKQSTTGLPYRQSSSKSMVRGGRTHAEIQYDALGL